MKIFGLIISIFIYYLIFLQCHNAYGQKYAIVIHGGAGNFSENDISETKQLEYSAKLMEALVLGDSILKNNGTSLQAVEQVIKILEDSPLFNAGKGAVFTNAGTNELDASIMDGKTLKAGAVAGVGDIKNPISAALKVMTNSNHVLLAGKGASIFAREQGLEIVDSSYFYTEERFKALEKQKSAEEQIDKKGTVGCVALDNFGNIAAGTSTGGMSNKKYGRVGDSPIIGAGTYADNQTCGISCTGHGEFFIRYAVAYDVSALIKYKGMQINEAADFVINDKLKNAKADGGLIGIDKNGNICMVFNTTGMFRGSATNNKKPEVFMFGEK
ncbi:MAG: isoaspartyl peptidase/L-asparaginase [Bacteroidales bacterium]|nr:isoaspartyl peptidase/L-asparaginase [Bacteroidales bacterium]